jgi:hypothetical protein
MNYNWLHSVFFITRKLGLDFYTTDERILGRQEIIARLLSQAEERKQR